MITLPKEIKMAIHLRSPSSSGGKDWIGGVDDSGFLHSFWGKTHQVNQHKRKPGSLAELDRLIRSQLDKGYKRIAQYHWQNGWVPASEGPPVKAHTPQHKRKPVKIVISDQALSWDF